MWKVLLVLGAVVLTVAAAVVIAQKDERATAQCKQDAANLVARGWPIPYENQAAEDECKPERYTPSWYGIFRWPNGTTAIALLLTLIVLTWQSAETSKAAEAGRDAAQAALRQADHLSATERAWIKVTPHVASFTFRPLREKNAPVPENLVEAIPIAHQFPARIENAGKTPAKIVGSAIRYIRSRTHPSGYPPVPDYGTLTEFEMYVFPEMKDVTLAGQLEPTATLTTAQIKAIEDREEFLFAYGIIKYLDVYGHPHETRFGYAYEAQVSHSVQVDAVIHTVKTGEGHFRIGGPKGYNGHS